MGGAVTAANEQLFVDPILLLSEPYVAAASGSAGEKMSVLEHDIESILPRFSQPVRGVPIRKTVRSTTVDANIPATIRSNT
jgi:hypothetical protein